MPSIDLGKLSRKELLEMLIEQGKELERLQSELDDAKLNLSDRKLKIDDSGTMAQAAIAVNKVFEAADEAAAQYIENIKRCSENKQKDYDRMIKNAEKEAEAIIKEAKEKAQKTIADAEEEKKRRIKDANAYWQMVYQRAEDLRENKTVTESKNKEDK